MYYKLSFTGLLQRVRPLPSNFLNFKGRFKMCSNNPCTRDYCTFAHSDLELQVWNKQKKNILDSKLSCTCYMNCTYVAMYICMQACTACICMHTYMHICIHTCLHACMHTHTSRFTIVNREAKTKPKRSSDQ